MAQPPNPSNTFLIEVDDLLTQIEEITLDFNAQAPDPEAVNQLFRAFHTIKGSGSMFGFDQIASFTHHVETALDQVRSGVLTMSPALLSLVLAAKDQIKALLEETQQGTASTEHSGHRIVMELNSLCNVSESAPADPSVLGKGCAGKGDSDVRTFRIRFRPDPAMMTYGTNPVSLLNELRALGECVVVAHTDSIPPLDQIQPEHCYLWWDITLTTRSGINAIKDIFIFVEDGSEIMIESAKAGEEHGEEEQSRVGQSITLVQQMMRSASPQRPVPVALSGKVSASAAKNSTIRVPSERLDRLVALVGEMVMNQSRLTQVAASADLPNLTGPVEELERLVAELRDNVLGIRMMPIGATFSRFKRLVYDLSMELGKEIDLVTEGGETELDKTVLDQLGDPLVHLIRNSLDHGIELAEVREKCGKSRRGTIRLAAVHTGSNVVVTIEDDGKGLDPEVIRAKAIEKNLIPPGSTLSEKDIFNLIFLPGFSTATKVTNVSGRGVGLDVVKRQIDALRGSVLIASELGKGTVISLTLPLTLAIIEGLLVEIGCDQFIVPMASVTENVELHRAERGRNNGRNVIAVRGELIPYLRLRELFGESEGELDVEKIVIMQHQEQRVGIVVDRVLGNHQTVIQSLGRFYRNIEIVSGATIMGDGRVALIFDLPGLVQFAAQQAPSARR